MSIGEQGKRATFRELWRQFRFPLIVAVVWTTLRGWEAMPINAYPAFLATVVAQFGSAFFLLSWAWGQYNRVDRQQDTTARLTICWIASSRSAPLFLPSPGSLLMSAERIA